MFVNRTIKILSNLVFLLILSAGQIAAIPNHGFGFLVNEPAKAATSSILFSNTANGYESSLNTSNPIVGNGTTMRDIVLVFDTSVNMAYETDGIAGQSVGDDPSVCNLNNTCQPMKAVKDATLGFLDTLDFPNDRIAVITMTSQMPGGDRRPREILPLTSIKADVISAINGIKVFEPRDCDHTGANEGPCLNYDGNGNFIGTICEILEMHASEAGADPSSCPSSNVGGVLNLARNTFTEYPVNTRPDALWMAIPLLSGPANATDIVSLNYPNGFCPPYTWTYPWITPSNIFLPELDRYGDGGAWCRDKKPSVRHHATDSLIPYTNPISAVTTDISYYDADDYARDKADELATLIDSGGVTIFSIGLGAQIKSTSTVDPGESPAAEALLQYVAECAGEGSIDDCATPVTNPRINHGQYFYAPTKASLVDIFQFIANNTTCSPAIVVTNDQNAGAGSLRQAILDICSGGTIAFDPSLSGGTIYLASSLLIDKGLTIDGSTLASHIQTSGDTNNDGAGDVSVFQISGSSPVELKGLNIIKGKASGTTGGGGIANFGTLTLTNVILSGNSYIGGIGGGGIYNSGDLTLINGTITANLAEDGGGIFNEYGHTLTITGSTFSDNGAESSNALRGSGGGIANIGTLSVDNSEFLDNHAYAGGGAIVNSINGVSTVISSSFTNNSSFGNGNGGAINNHEGGLTIENCTFTANSDFGVEGDGAAVHNEDQMSIAGSTFTGNSSSHHGGGIANLGVLTVTNSILSSNSAFSFGGGIFNSGNLTITNTNISENTAAGGGGVLNDNNGLLTVVNSTISNNSASSGGGIFNLSDTGTINISSSTLSGNSVSDNGGGISNWGTLNATNITISGNSAKLGGGIFNILETSTVTNSTISGNSALTSGGGVYNASILNYANTIIANSTSGEDCFNDSFGIIGTNINNLVENNSASPNQCGVPDLNNDPNLGPLANNGGSTLTMSLLPDSPAIDSGDDAVCVAMPVSNTSQNGVTRPQGAHCDIGAYEYLDTILPTVISSVRVSASPTNLAIVDFTVAFSESVTGVDIVAPFNDFNLTTSPDINGASVTSVMGSGAAYTVTVNTGSGNGTIRLDVVDDNSIVDAASNPLGGAAVGDGNFTTGEVYTIDKSGGDTTGVFRPGNGLLYLKNANTTGFADVAINYGTGGDYPIAGDWDGNGTATIGIYRNGSFYLRNSNTLGFADIVFAFGTPGDQPVAGDWDGDGVDTIGVYSNGQFLLRNSNSAGTADMSFYLGNPGDVGIAGDWNGDGSDTTGVFRPSNGIIFLKNANTSGFADVALNYGLAGDRPVTGDWNNDGIDTIGVYRNAQFMLRNSNTIGFAEIVFALGNPGDMPISGNWDGIP
jgi:hypothetical protein